MTMRERFEKSMRKQGFTSRDLRVNIDGDYIDLLVDLRWKEREVAERQFWPPRPSPEQLASAGVRLVGEEPVMVGPIEHMPSSFWSDHPIQSAPFACHIGNEHINYSTKPVFVWRVERVEK